MKRYVMGFMFDYGEQTVVLLRKDHPDWQAGRLNGVGGLAEDHESLAAAMTREGEEEVQRGMEWERFATLNGDGFVMGCFRVAIKDFHPPPENDVGETLERHSVSNIIRGEQQIVPNVRWLLPMAIGTNRHDWPFLITENMGTG